MQVILQSDFKCVKEPQSSASGCHKVISLFPNLFLHFFLLTGESGQHSWLPNIDDLKTFVWLLPLVVIISTAVIIVIALFVWISLFVRFGGLILSYFKWSLYVQTGVGVKDWICTTVIIIISLLFCGTLSLIFGLHFVSLANLEICRFC